MSEVKTESIRIQMKAGDSDTWFLWEGYFPPSIEDGKRFVQGNPDLRLVKVVTTITPL